MKNLKGYCRFANILKIWNCQATITTTARLINMRKATRYFIKSRQPHCKYVVEQITNVRKLNTGQHAQCFKNSHSLINRTDGVKIVSGWLIGPYDSHNNITPIIQHWWNADKNGHFDSTPDISNDYVYVIDIDLFDFASLNYSNISSCVSSSLILNDSKFFLISNNDFDIHSSKPVNLKTETLFKANQMD